MANTKWQKDFPIDELEFKQPADELLNIVEHWYTRLYGFKPTWKEVLDMAKTVLESRK